MRTYVAMALLLASCTLGPSRTSTEQERAWANITINKLVVAITALQANGNIEGEQAALALQQLQELREVVEQSADRPVIWLEVFDRITTIALQWAIPLPPRNDE